MNQKFLGHIKFLPSLLWFMNFRISIIKSSLQWKCQTQQRKRFLSIFSAYHHARYLLNMWLIYCVFELECVPHVFGNFHTFIWEAFKFHFPKAYFRASYKYHSTYKRRNVELRWKKNKKLFSLSFLHFAPMLYYSNFSENVMSTCEWDERKEFCAARIEKWIIIENICSYNSLFWHNMISKSSTFKKFKFITRASKSAIISFD